MNNKYINNEEIKSILNKIQWIIDTYYPDESSVKDWKKRKQMIKKNIAEIKDLLS